MNEKSVRVSLTCADCEASSVVTATLHSDNVESFEQGEVDALLVCLCTNCNGTNMRLVTKAGLDDLVDDLPF